MRKIRKIIISFLCSLLVVLPIATIIKAAPEQEESTWMAISKARSNFEALNTTYSGEFGLYYNMFYLTRAIRWTEFIYFSDNFSQTEKDIYYEKMVNSVDSFNTAYGDIALGAGSNTIKLYELDDKKNIKNFMKVNINGYITTFLKEELNYLVKLSKSSNSSEQGGLKDQNTKIKYIYKILQVLAKEHLDMVSLVDKMPDLNITYSPSAETLLKDPAYSVLFEKAKELEAKELLTTDNVDLGNSLDNYIERMAWATKLELTKKLEDKDRKLIGADLWVPDSAHTDANGKEFRLKDVYFRMFSASSVYTPGVSYAGDIEYLEALSGLFPEESRGDVVQLYLEMKDYRKPLYAIYGYDTIWKDWFNTKGTSTKLTSEGKYTGKGSPAKLKDLMKAVKEENSMALLAVKGNLRTSSEDVNTYSYYSDNPLFTQPKATTKTTTVQSNNSEDSENNTTEVEESSEENSQSNADADSIGNSEVTETKTMTAEDLLKTANSVLADGSGDVVSQYWTDAILESGGIGSAFAQYTLPSMTMIVLKNYFKDTEYLKDSTDLDKYLFVNAFGDIVTSDNRIIVPGSANPKNYKQEQGYNPYTVMFMKGYPNMYDRSGVLGLGTESNVDKFIYVSSEDGINDDYVFFRIKGEDDIESTIPRLSMWINTKMAEPIAGIKSLFVRTPTDVELTRGFGAAWTHGSHQLESVEVYDKGQAVLKQPQTIPGASSNMDLLDYNPKEDEQYAVAKAIARNTFSYFRIEGEEISDHLNERLNEDHLFRNTLVEALNGTIYATSFSKTLNESTNNLEEVSFGALKYFSYKTLTFILNNLGKTSGVLGVEDSRFIYPFGNIYNFLEEFYLYIAVAMSVVFLVGYLRNKARLVYTVFMTVLVFCIITVTIKVVPNYSQNFINIVVNNTSMNLSYSVLLNKAETYSVTYAKGGSVDSKGNYNENTTSLDIYKLSDESLESLKSQKNFKDEDISVDRSYILDSLNGLYLKGNTLRLNMDLLFLNNPITGSYVFENDRSRYNLVGEKANSSSLDYYMPYYMIQDGFLTTLNDLLKVYVIPKYSATYPGGVTKDAFLVQNYIKSMPFLMPGSYKQENGKITTDEVARLSTIFDSKEENKDSHDFLNLTNMILKADSTTKDSLWYRTMMKNGYVPRDDTDEEAIKKLNALINSVNILTRDFILTISDKIGYVSDENIIKVISLYATGIFNSKISDLGEQVYPKTINYSELKLEDILLATLTSDTETYKASEGDLSFYVVNKTDFFSALIFGLAVIFLSLQSSLSNILFPSLLLLLGIIGTLRVLMGRKFSDPFKGFLKMSGLLFVAITLSSISLTVTHGWNTTLAIYTILLFSAISAVIVLVVCYSVLFNITEIGNSKLTSVGNNLLKLLKIDQLMNVTGINTRNIRKQLEHERHLSRASKYSLDRDPDIVEVRVPRERTRNSVIIDIESDTQREIAITKELNKNANRTPENKIKLRRFRG